MKIFTVFFNFTKMPSLLDYIMCCLACERPPKKYDNTVGSANLDRTRCIAPSEIRDNSDRANIGWRSVENDYAEKENDYEPT